MKAFQNRIPTYVKRMLKRASFAIETAHYEKGYDPSYTVIIPKHSIYAQADTLRTEVERLEAWALRNVYGSFPSVAEKKFPPVVVRHIPTETNYCKQYAVLDIYDPVMLRVEHLIPRINH
jgi:hypothetical protein